MFIEIYNYTKNSCTQVSENLLDENLEMILLNHQNNYISRSN